MNTRNWLGGLLAVQLVLAAGLALNTLRERDADNSAPLLDFPVANVDRVVIDDNASNATTLARTGDSWQVESLNGLPANAAKADGLLESLAGLQTTMPVVSTAAGRERFEVTEEKFQRRLRLYDGENLLGEYFFGTSPGFRRTHGRSADADEVYALALNNFDLPGDGNDWLDKTLLAASAPQKIRGPGFELVKEAQAWKLADASETEQLDTARVNELVSAFESLRIMRAEDTMPEGEWIELGVTTAAGEWQYEFLAADSKYYVKRSDQARVFTLSQADFDRIAGKERSDFIVAPATTDAAAADSNA